MAPIDAAITKTAICVLNTGSSTSAKVLNSASNFSTALVQKLLAIDSVASATMTTANSFKPAIMS